MVIYLAVPAVMIIWVGSPLPSSGLATLTIGRGIFDVLAVVLWVTWIVGCWSIARDVASHVRRGEVRTQRPTSWTDRLSACIATGALVVVTSGMPGTPNPYAAGSVPPSVLSGPATSRDAAVAAVTAPAERDGGSPGESLWQLADRVWGDGSRWPELAADNLGRPMADGTVFVDPAVVRPGWRLSVPDGIDHTGEDPPALGPVQDVEVRQVVPRSGRSTPTVSGLPELAALGFGTLLAAAIARRVRVSRRRRRTEPAPSTEDLVAPRGEDGSWRTTEPIGADTVSLVAPFDRSPLLEMTELALRHLALALGTARSFEASYVRAVHVGVSGVVLILQGDAGPAPWGWLADGDPTRWRLPADTDLDSLRLEVGSTDPLLPVIVSVGTDQTGTWLLPVQPGRSLAVVGAAGPSLLGAMVRSLDLWSWSECLRVTDDVTDDVTPDEASDRRRTVVVDVGEGPPRPDLRSCAVLTNRPDRAGGTVVVADTDVATIHPLGITLRPDRIEPHRAAELDAVLGPVPRVDAPAEAPVRRRDGPSASPAIRRPPAALRPARAARGGDGGSIAPVDPGLVEVRLLTALPRIDGLAEPLPAKRARRATELVAYLALHFPDPVTSDRLRTRVLGSADADAAAKTLFNTAAAARRGLGVGADDSCLLPPASKTGRYSVSPDVTVDARRAVDLVNAAGGAPDADLAMALYRSALELVEGEPLAAVRAGYGWWEAEGHGGRLVTSLERAGCALADLASADGLDQLAVWAIERARLIEPYSESLSCAAMRVAAMAGETDRLRREWAECQRRVADLCPGAEPSEPTTRLYHHLAGRRQGSDELSAQASLAAIDAAPRSTNPSAPAVLQT